MLSRRTHRRVPARSGFLRQPCVDGSAGWGLPPQTVQRPGRFCPVAAPSSAGGPGPCGRFWLAGRCPPYSLRKGPERGAGWMHPHRRSLSIGWAWPWPHLAAREAEQCHPYWMAVHPVITQGQRLAPAAWPVVTKYHRQNNRNLLLAVLEAGVSKVKAPAGSRCGEDRLRGSWPAPSLCVLMWGKGQGSALESLLRGH